MGGGGAVYDPGSKRLYVAGVPSLNVFELRGPNRFRQIGQLPTSFHAVTGILVPELNRYYVAVNHHGETPAQVQIYDVVPSATFAPSPTLILATVLFSPVLSGHSTPNRLAQAHSCGSNIISASLASGLALPESSI